MAWDKFQAPLEDLSKYEAKIRWRWQRAFRHTKKPRNIYWSTEENTRCTRGQSASLRLARTPMRKQDIRHIKSDEINYSEGCESYNWLPPRIASYISGWGSHFHKMNHFGILLDLHGTQGYWVARWTSKASSIWIEMEPLLSPKATFRSRMDLRGYCRNIHIEIWTSKQWIGWGIFLHGQI